MRLAQLKFNTIACHVRTSFFLLAIVFLLAMPSIYAQTLTTGDITGTITDQTGAVIPGATVTLTNEATGANQVTKSTNDGTYRFSFLPPGEYRVSAQSAGLKTQLAHTTVGVGQVTTLNLTATVQETRTTVEVTEVAPVMETENANLARTFTSNQMLDLPAPGSDITTVAFTVPGINENVGSGYGNFSTHGMSGLSNLFTINGNDYNDPYLNLNNSGASNLLLGQNEIAEASVVQNAYSVQYGRNAGAQVNYVTKSGTNQFHGNLQENWNGTLLNANDFFNNLNDIPRPHAISNNYSASIGGRVKKDKLFFFADTEGLRYTLPSSADVAIPSPQLQQYALSNIPASAQSLYQTAFKEFSGVMNIAQPVTNGTGPLQDGSGNLGCGAAFAGLGVAAPGGGIFGATVPCAYAYATNASNTNIEWLMTYRADWNINDNNKIYFRYKADRGRQPTGTNVVNPLYNVQSIQPQDEGQINWTTTISPTLVNNFIGSVLWYSAIFTSGNLSTVTQTLPVNLDILNAGINGAPTGYYPMGFGYQPSGVVDFGYNIFPQGRDSGQLGIVDDLSWVRGRHNLKVGVNLRKNRVTDYSPLENAYGTYTFQNVTDFVNGVTNPTTGSFYSQTFAPVGDVHIRLYNIGFYAQDEWNITKNIKLTYGLRAERTGDPSCLDDCFSRFNVPFTSSSFQTGANLPYNASVLTGLTHAYPAVDAIDLLPRAGIVWSPRGANGTVIRAGGGLFADLAPGGISPDIFENFPYLYTANISGGQAVGAPAASAALDSYNALRSGFANGATLTSLSNEIPGFGAPNFFSTPAHLHTPTYAEWSFEVEQPFGQKNVAVITYAGNHGYNELLFNPFPNIAYTAASFPNGFGGLPANPPDPRFADVTQLTNGGYSNYEGLTIQFRRALGYGFQGQIGYTWSHALDTLTSLPGEPYSFADSLVTLTSPNPKANYSNADTDIRHSLLADFVWNVPWKFSSPALGYLLGGWTLSSKFYARSGTPFSVIDAALAGAVSPALASVPAFYGPVFLDATPLPGTATHCGTSAVNIPCFTTANFVASGSETGFGSPRNSFYGPGYFDIDTSLYKDFHIRERAVFRFGATATNILNHPNFANPGDNIAGGLGTITSTVGPPTSPYGAFQGSAVNGRVLVLTGRFQF